MAGIDSTLRWINFRATAAYVTDGANQSSCTEDLVGQSLYGNGNNPGISIGGQTYTCGWVVSSGNKDERNRSTGVDPRLAGCHFITQNSSKVMDFRLDLDAPGLYEFHLALGDALYAKAKTYCAIYDNTTLVQLVVDDATGTGGGEFFDATGVKRTSASNWVTNEAGVQVTLATSTLKIRLGKAANASGDVTIATFGIKLVGATNATGSPVTAAATAAAGTITPLPRPAPPYVLATVTG